MKKMFLMATLLTFLIPAAAGAADPYGFDLNGIKFGMTGAEARALIEKKDPAFEFSEFMQGDEIVGYKAALHNKAESNFPTDVILVMFDKDTGVWQVSRAQKFPDGGRPTMERLRESIYQKFGLEPRDKENTSSRLFRVFDRDGRLYDEKEAMKNCGSMAAGSMQRAVERSGIMVPGNFQQPCGVVLQVNFTEDLNDEEMAFSYSVTMIDGKARYDRLSAAKAAAEKAAKEKLDREKAAGASPDL